MPRPILDLATALANVLGGSFTLATNVFPSPVRPAGDGVPDEAIFVGKGTQPPPDKLFRGKEIRNAAIQIRSRGERGDFDGADILADSIRDATRFMDVSPGSDLEDYMSVEAVDSEPNSLGQDDQEHWEHSVNVEMKYVDG